MLPFLLATLGTTALNNSNPKDYCYSARIRSTVLQGLPFGGVPTVLALDFMCFLALLFLFSILRKVAWDYGRLALVTDAGKPWPLSCPSPHLSPLLPHACRDDEIRDKCGGDAVHYLSFQRHIIGLLVVVGVLSVGIVLPVNFSGDLLENNAYSFGRTTIANLKSGNNLLWLHTSFAFLYLLLTVYSMRRHTSKMRYKEDDLVSGVGGVPTEGDGGLCFREAYPNCTVLEARPCYNVARLMFLDAERKKAERGKLYFTNLQSKENVPTMINPKPCGHLCCCVVRGCEQVEAIEYYTKLEQKLKEDYKREKEKVNEKPLGMAFVTFHNETITAIILKDFNVCKCQGCTCRGEPRASSCSESLHISNWTVSYAPDPQNIYWEHLSIRGFIWWLRCLVINVVLFILLFFLTTPAIIITTMDKFNVTKPVEYLNNPIITQFFPTLLLWCFSALLPTIVYYSAFFEAHWTRSGENRTTMHKSLPSCPSPPQHQAYEFQFGAAYAWMMCVFTVVMTYSITCPIIVPFGLMYMLLKHLVDRYNLYYAYLPAKLDKKIHSGAVNQVVAAPILCLFWLLFFSTMRTGFLAPTSMFTFVVLVITIVICLCHVCFGHFKYLSAHNYKVWGEGGRGWLRAEAQRGAGEQGDGWELMAGAARVSRRCGVLMAAEGKDIFPLPDSFWVPQD
uniref:Transmembrane protein 63B n=1 Tax=Ursus maritimus TaxID=29073 RepID=A0A452THS4_URSMA